MNVTPKAVRFDRGQHYGELCQWCLSRGIEFPPLELLPATGRIVPGFGALFLYLTDSGVGFIESMISNPKADAEEASQALDACVDAIETDAIGLGVKFLWGSTFIPGVADRAKRHGFSVRPEKYKLITKRVT